MTSRGDSGVYRRRRGALSYGHVWGTIMLDFDSPFVPGDMGNASTYDGSVLFARVPGLTVRAILDDVEGTFQHAVVEAARWLVSQGATTITSNCGFMIRYQTAVAEAVGDRPVMLSSLLQLPFIAATVAPRSQIGIVTADARTLTPAFIDGQFAGVGDRVRVVGLQDSPHFRRTMFDDDDELDAGAIAAETVNAVRRLRSADPALVAVLLECAALPAYAAAIQDEWPGMLVYDFSTLMASVSAARDRVPFFGAY